MSPKTKQVDRTTDLTWKELSKLKNYSDDDNKIDAVVENVDIDDKRKKAEITFQPMGIDHTFSHILDAKVKPDRPSEFDIFLDNYNYQPIEDNLESNIEGETIEVMFCDNNTYTSVDIIITENTDTDIKDEIADRSKYVFGFIIGLLPIINILVVRGMVNNKKLSIGWFCGLITYSIISFVYALDIISTFPLM